MDEAIEIRRHIEVLSEFEQKYDEFLVARRNRQVIPEIQWSQGEWAKRERDLRMLAPRADAAIDASGVAGLALHWPPALGGGVKADDLPSLIFDFQDTGFNIEATDDEFQQAILERIPSQVAGLQMQLEKIEARGRRRVKLPHPTFKWNWLNHPWVVGIGVTVIGGALLAAILALLH